MMRSLFLLAGCVFTLFSCNKQTPRFERLDASTTGIHFNNEVLEQDSFNILHNEYMYNGGGVGVADLNNDGLSDLIFTGNKVSSRIFLNEGEMHFRDITGRFQGLSNDQWISGVAVTDINSDGWQDLYFTSTMNDDSLKRKNRLWVNQGLSDGNLPSFKEMAAGYGVADLGHSMHAAFLDYDLDGDLDLYVLNNILGRGVPTNYRAKITDGSSVNNDKFYRNLGNGRFEEVSKEVGIVYEGYGLGVATGDINKDGYPDLYISNDYISNDLLYINQGDGTFRNEIGAYMSYQSRFSMGNDMSDINNDGCLDVMTLDMMPEEYARKKQTINGNSYQFYLNNVRYGYEPQYVRNMVHMHNGFLNGKMLPFSEVGQIMGVYQTEWSWSPLFADFDNDGDRDLMVSNGFPKDLTDKDFTNYKAQMHGYLITDQELIPKIPVVKVSNYAYENTGGLRFTDRTKDWGMDMPSFSNGAAYVDLDNDGDLDYVVNNINDEAFVYRNNTIGKLEEKANYLKLALNGAGANTMAIGAKVELWTNGKLQYYEHFLNRGYLSSVDPVIHFGLGAGERIDSLRVIWPTGKSSTFLKDVKPNQLLALKESEATPFSNAILAFNQEDLLFSAQENGIAYTHVQKDYIDFFQNQRIIQHKFSQIGPCMAKGDLDGDKSEDLLIGGAPESPCTAFVNKGGTFTRTDFPGLTTEARTCTESDLAVTDIDGDGDNDVVVVAGGYANESDEDYKHYLFLNNGGSFSRVALPIPAFPASVVRPFDVDHDGDMDLFIGARVKRLTFPFAPESYLLINDNGKFSSGGLKSFNLGMVTDAVWTDVDGDKWEDLLITREWNSLALLKNNRGKEFKPVAQKDLEGKHGFWDAIAAGDLDQDGDDDYIVGNLGENHRFRIDEEYPLQLYAPDLDNNGIIDPVTTGYWKDFRGEMQEYPVNYLDELAAQSPFFRKKFRRYTAFSNTTVDSIINKSSLDDDHKFRVNTSSSFILWNEGGRLEWERLPDPAQVAPVKEILVRDFNGDNRPDILLAGNDHSYDVSTGYYDANKGLILLGRGNRTFEVLPPAKSGLLLKGQVGSLIYFGGETPTLVAGINRGKAYLYRQMPIKFLSAN